MNNRDVISDKFYKRIFPVIKIVADLQIDNFSGKRSTLTKN